MEKLYTINEVADILKVNRKTLYEWRKNDKISFIMIGARNRITESELKRIVKGENNGNGYN